ncbi:MAG: DUF4292 domain-containing protein [Candidatus Cyclobacteriaceae bacterium M3_2C_046]
MNKIWWGVVLLGIIVTGSSCSKKVSVSDYYKKNKKFEIQHFDFDYLSSRARVRYNDGSKNMVLNANIRIKKDSIIWVSLSPALGIEVARGLITPDSIAFLNRVEKEYKVYDYALLSKQFNFNINFHLLQSMILGNMPKETNLNDRMKKNKGYYLVEQEIGPFTIENYISSKTMKVEKVIMMEHPSNNSLVFAYDDFQVIEKMIFPYSSDISLNYHTADAEASTKVNIAYSRIDLGDEKLNFPFNVPDKYDKK